MARSSIKIRESIISNAIARGITTQIDAAVAGIPGITPAAASVPLMSITLDDIMREAEKAAQPERSTELPSDEAIISAVMALGTDAQQLDANSSAYVRATKVAKRLGVTTTEIRRRMRALVKSGRLITIGKAAGKRYAVAVGQET